MTYKPVLDEIQRQIDSGLIQGAAVRTNRNGETIALGIQAGAIPMTAQSRFDIASTGKVFTAACVALLALEMIYGIYASHRKDGARVTFPLNSRKHPLSGE